MKKKLSIGLVCLLLLSACQKTQQPVLPKKDAVLALEDLLSVNDEKLYVYKDHAMGWNRFVLRSWMGEKGIKPPDMDEYCNTEPYEGMSCINARIDFTAQAWGGYIFTNGSLASGGSEPVTSSGNVPSGNDLTGAVSLVFYAKGKNGGEKVEFFCGGMGYDTYGAAAPYADSTPAVGTGTVTLTKEWKEYRIPLKDKDISSIGHGFAWIAYADQNKQADGIEFYMDEIYYRFDRGTKQMLLAPSYEPYATDTEEYILNSIAYTNDNALACIALLRAGKTERARQIADALVFAAWHDRSFSDGRLRNGYNCGNIESYPHWNSFEGGKYSLIPGFYHQQTKKWHEDFYTVSTSLSSLARSVLALSEAYTVCPEKTEYLEAAKRIASFALTLEDGESGGFYSGYDGWEGAQTINLRKPTGDNIQMLAAFRKLLTIPGLTPAETAAYEKAAESAGTYALSQFDQSKGCFLPGTGIAISPDVISLADNALAILVLSDAYDSQKEAALQYIEQHLSVGGGFGYGSADLSGIGWEGTGLMALVYMKYGRMDLAGPVIANMEAAQSDDGMMTSTDISELFTGFTGFYDNRRIYLYNRKHLGTTAMKALVDMGENPFMID